MKSIQYLKELEQARRLGLRSGKSASTQEVKHCPYPNDSEASAHWMAGFIISCEKRGVEPIVADGRNARLFVSYTPGLNL